MKHKLPYSALHYTILALEQTIAQAPLSPPPFTDIAGQLTYTARARLGHIPVIEAQRRLANIQYYLQHWHDSNSHLADEIHLLQTGMMAPLFEGLEVSGEITGLHDLLGAPSIIFFYPAERKQDAKHLAQSLNQMGGVLQQHGIQLLGIIALAAEDAARLKRELQLDFPLLCNQNGSIFQQYGVKVATRLGTLFGLSQRTTFLLNNTGRIMHILQRPDPMHHGEEVLAQLALLTNGDL